MVEQYGLMKVGNIPTFVANNVIQDSGYSVSDIISGIDPSSVTTFNSDGSIATAYASGLIVTTTFNSNGSITDAYSPPVSKTVTTIFNADGSITTTVA